MKPGKTTEYLIVALLAAITVLAIVVTIFQFRGGLKAIPGAPTEFRFRCTKCEYEWMVDREQLLEYYGGGRPIEGSPQVDCPNCKAKKTAFQLLQCPACHEFFPPQFLRQGESPSRSRGLICPKCGQNIHEWYRKRAPEAM